MYAIQEDDLFRPEIANPTIVLDARVCDHNVDPPIDEVGYYIGKDQDDLEWVPKEDRRVQAALKRRIERKRESEKSWLTSKVVFLGGFILVLVLPFVIIKYKTSKTSDSTWK